MAEPRTEPEQFNWRLPLRAALCAPIVMLLLFIWAGDPALNYVFVIVPVICLCCLFCLVLFAFAALRKKQSRSLSMLLALVAFLVVSGALLRTQGVIRPSLRWLLWSHRLKAEVLTQPSPANGEMKHIEWDAWGGAPVGDWTAYIVFDPTDSLSRATQSRSSGSSYNRYKGIPCEVESVRRLESYWYSVVLGVNEWWGRCS